MFAAKWLSNKPLREIRIRPPWKPDHGGLVVLIDHARRAWVWPAPQSGADCVTEGPVGAGVHGSAFTRTT